MSIYRCLSMLELAAHRAGEGQVPGTEEHLANCPRCRALLTLLPELEEPTDAESRTMLSIAPRSTQEQPADVRTGQIWSATTEDDSEWREVVVVLARQPAVEGRELVLIAPVDTSLSDATSTDVIIDRSPLGYPHIVNVGLQGVILRDQLVRYLGRLERPEREALADVYRGLFAESEPTTRARIGPPLVGSEDPRASARAARIDELRPLFAVADRLLGSEQSDAEVVTLGTILTETMNSDEWDRHSLLSAAAVEGASLDRMLRNELDLTDQTDLGEVQRVINVIQLEDWRDPVRHSLILSPGGLRVATGGTEPAIAARSFAGVSGADRERDLMRDRTSVDQSVAARAQAIESYLRSLEKELDDAE